MEKMKSTMNKYVGSSKSVFAQKAGLEKTVRAEKLTMEDFANLAEILKK